MNLPKKLLVGTNNPGKFPEIKSLLNQCGIEAISAFSFNFLEPEETGNSFAENALIKAKFYAKNTGLATIADDSGFCIDVLNGQPGIGSARFAIDEKTNKKNFPFAFEKIYSALKQKGFDFAANPNLKVSAYFICNLTIFDPNNDAAMSFEGRVDGFLSPQPRGDKGFGYDPIFIKNEMNQTFAELDPEFKDSISHRAVAFKKIIKRMSNY